MNVSNSPERDDTSGILIEAIEYDGNRFIKPARQSLGSAAKEIINIGIMDDDDEFSEPIAMIWFDISRCKAADLLHFMTDPRPKVREFMVNYLRETSRQVGDRQRAEELVRIIGQVESSDVDPGQQLN